MGRGGGRVLRLRLRRRRRAFTTVTRFHDSGSDSARAGSDSAHLHAMRAAACYPLLYTYPYCPTLRRCALPRCLCKEAPIVLLSVCFWLVEAAAAPVRTTAAGSSALFGCGPLSQRCCRSRSAAASSSHFDGSVSVAAALLPPVLADRCPPRLRTCTPPRHGGRRARTHSRACAPLNPYTLVCGPV